MSNRSPSNERNRVTALLPAGIAADFDTLWLNLGCQLCKERRNAALSQRCRDQNPMDSLALWIGQSRKDKRLHPFDELLDYITKLESVPEPLYLPYHLQSRGTPGKM